MTQTLKCHQNWNVNENDVSSELKCHQNWNVTRTEMSPTPNCHQNWDIIRTEMSPKLKCHQNWNFTKYNNVLKVKIKIKIKIEIQEIGPDYLGLVILFWRLSYFYISLRNKTIIFLNVVQNSSKKKFWIEIWTFSFEICIRNEIWTSGSGQTENTRICVFLVWPLLEVQNWLRNQISNEMCIFLF